VYVVRLVILALGIGILSCETSPTTSTSYVVEDCRNFAPNNCLLHTVSANVTREANGKADVYRYCYCLNTEKTEVLQYAAPTKALLRGLGMIE